MTPAAIAFDSTKWGRGLAALGGACTISVNQWHNVTGKPPRM